MLADEGNEFVQNRHINVNENPQQWIVRASVRFALKRQWYADNQVVVFIIAKYLVIEVSDFMPLTNDDDSLLTMDQTRR